MKIYTCPMHPEIEQNTPGTCPKCGGMKLVLKGSQDVPSSNPESVVGMGKPTWRNYIPLMVIIGLILVTSLTLSIRDLQTGMFSVSNSISYFMIGFFLTFAGFKLLDLKGFSEGYRTYDILAKKLPVYGLIYPFIELSFGLGMILLPHATWLLVCEIVVMVFSGLGVAIKLLKKEKFQCACLGTFLKIPLTKVTIIEDFGMAFLALVMLLL